MENQKYVEPEMEVIMFDFEDVITTSGGHPVGGGGGIVLPDDEW